MNNARIAWAVGMSLALGSPSSPGRDRFPTMASVQGRMPCGSCRVPSTISSKETIAPSSEAGERLVISGIVYEPDGVTPAPATTIFVYHTDAKGHYNSPDDALNPRLYGGCAQARTVDSSFGPSGQAPIHRPRPLPTSTCMSSVRAGPNGSFPSTGSKATRSSLRRIAICRPEMGLSHRLCASRRTAMGVGEATETSASRRQQRASVEMSDVPSNRPYLDSPVN